MRREYPHAVRRARRGRGSSRREEGTGFPVVLHTGGAGDGAMWDGAGYAERLAGFRLILLDHRGRGRVSRVPGIDGHVPAAYVADVVATADAVGARAFAFVGYSMGAAVGYRLAAAHGDRVAALISIGGVADDPGEVDDPAGLIDLLEKGGAPALSRAIESEEGALPGWLRQNFDETDCRAVHPVAPGLGTSGRLHMGRPRAHPVPDRARRRHGRSPARIARADGRRDPGRRRDGADRGPGARGRVPRFGGRPAGSAPRPHRGPRQGPSVDFPP